jgi:hypothetical protein
MHLGMRCCLAGCRSQRLSCEELIGADETNPSRGPRPPESKKNGRVVLYYTHLQQKWLHGQYMYVTRDNRLPEMAKHPIQALR